MKSITSQRISNLLEINGYSKKDFAELAGITPSHLSRILNDKVTLSSKNLERFSQILNVDPKYLTGDSLWSWCGNQPMSIEGENIKYKKKEQLLLKLLASADFRVDEYIQINSDLFLNNNMLGYFFLHEPHAPKEVISDGDIRDIEEELDDKHLTYSEMTTLIEQTCKSGGEVEHLYVLYSMDYKEVVWLSSLDFKKYIDQLYTLLITDVKHLGHKFDYPSYSTPLPDKWDIIIQQRKAQYGINQEESE